jgi:hypothetical protein
MSTVSIIVFSSNPSHRSFPRDADEHTHFLIADRSWSEENVETALQRATCDQAWLSQDATEAQIEVVARSRGQIGLVVAPIGLQERFPGDYALFYEPMAADVLAVLSEVVRDISFVTDIDTIVLLTRKAILVLEMVSQLPPAPEATRAEAVATKDAKTVQSPFPTPKFLPLGVQTVEVWNHCDIGVYIKTKPVSIWIPLGEQHMFLGEAFLAAATDPAETEDYMLTKRDSFPNTYEVILKPR